MAPGILGKLAPLKTTGEQNLYRIPTTTHAEGNGLMALDYRKIRKDKEQEYGTKVGNYGRLLANLYSDRAHFIFELLQNAEDALRDRGEEWAGPRAVSFNLTKNHLRFNHFGRPFEEADVRGICEI